MSSGRYDWGADNSDVVLRAYALVARSRPRIRTGRLISGASWLDRVADQLPSSPAFQLAAPPAPVVRVLVQAVPLLLPEHALRIGLSDLRATTEEYVSPERCAQGVGSVLAALAGSELIQLRRALFEAVPPESDSNPL